MLVNKKLSYEKYDEMHRELINYTPVLVLPPRVKGIVFHVMFTSRTIGSSWIQVRCTCLSYRPLSVGSTRR